MPTTPVIDGNSHAAVEPARPERREGGSFVRSTTSNVSPRQDTCWWQGSVMEIKARADDAGGALGVLEGRFFEQR